jgi:hypothetical protein
MVLIKIQCDCGQKYAFDVEPVNGRMPSPITCPACGVDGTVSANDTIARHMASVTPIVTGVPIRITPIALVPAPEASIAPVAVAASSPASVTIAPATPSTQSSRLSISTHAPAVAAPKADIRRGLMDLDQAKHEARAKAMWGDTQQQVAGFLTLQGFSHAEANEIASTVFKERAAAVRANGIRKMIIGFSMMWVPVIAFIVFRIIGFFPLKLMGAAVVVGLIGVWKLINGFLMFIAPKSEKGDVANQ